MARYKILEKLGEGGMGEVYRAIQLPLGRPVAVKLLPLAQAQNRTFIKRFLREVKVSVKIQHPNIIQIFDYGELDGQPFYAMEVIEGRTLSDLIEQSPQEAMRQSDQLMQQLFDALAAIHGANLLHRDIKTGNVMVDSAGHLTLMDFGLAKDHVDPGTLLTEQGKVVGTPVYLAPEILRGGTAGPAADVWAAGCVYFKLVTGELPFSGAELVELMRRVISPDPVDLSLIPFQSSDPRLKFVERVLAKELDTRFRDGRAASRAWRRIIGSPDDAEVQALVRAEELQLAREAGANRGGNRDRDSRTFAGRPDVSMTGAITRKSIMIPLPVQDPDSRKWIGAGMLVALLVLAGAVGMGHLLAPEPALLLVASASPSEIETTAPDPGPSPLPDPFPTLKQALFRIRPHAFFESMCTQMQGPVSKRSSDPKAFDRALLAHRQSLDGLLREHGLHDAVAAIGPKDWISSSRPRPNDAKFLYDGILDIVRLAQAFTEQGLPMDLPVLQALDPEFRPILDLPEWPCRSRYVVFSDDDFPSDRLGAADKKVLTGADSNLNLWVPGSAPRADALFKKNQMRRVSDDFEMEDPILTGAEPCRFLVFEIGTRYYDGGERMVFTFTSTETGRSVSVTVDGRDGAGGRCLHVIPSSWLVGSQKVRIHYAACIALGEFGNCQVAYLGFHSLKAPSGVTFVPVGSLN